MNLREVRKKATNYLRQKDITYTKVSKPYPHDGTVFRMYVTAKEYEGFIFVDEETGGTTLGSSILPLNKVQP